jgi:serine/threonine protein kinase
MAFLLKDYKDIQEIARGGMGKVYLSTQISLNRKVIIKEMATGLLTNVSEIKRFENEARAAALLSHDNIIRIYDFGEDRGSFYISMEYVDGPDLETILKDRYCIPEIALMIVLHALKGLSFAHQHQIIHRDIKPGNILVSKAGAVKVVDFGLAHASQQQLHLTATDMIVGTPLYMSPEQASGEEKKNIQMDIWSVGVLLYRIITGDFPFKGENVPAILFQIVQSKQKPVRELAPALPDGLAETIDLCLEKDRAQRLSSLAPIIESLQNYFYEIGVRDTAEQVRKYVFDPASSVKELSKQLMEFYGRRANELEDEGNPSKAYVYLQEAKKYDPMYKPPVRPPDTFKKHTSSSIIKKSPDVTQTTGYVQRHAPSKKPRAKNVVIAAFVFAVALAGGGALYYWLSNKSAEEQTVPPLAVLSVSASNASTDSSLVPVADTAKKTDSLLNQTMPAKENPAMIPDRPAQKKMRTDARPKPAQKNKQTAQTKKAADVPQPSAAKQPHEAPVPGIGILKVSINPASAEVNIDGAKLSARDMSEGKALKSGSHQLVASAPGYDIYFKTVTVEKGAVQIISADLVAQQAKGLAAVHIHSYPWAEIYIDGTFQGNSPTAKPITVSEGPHKITLKRGGYKTYEETVTIGKGELRRIKVQLAGE